jgi:hypothetical protein
MPIPDSDVKDGFKAVERGTDKVLEAEKKKSEVNAYVRELIEMEMAIEARDPKTESEQIKFIENKISKLRKDWLNRTLEIKDAEVRSALAKIVREELDAARSKARLPVGGSPVGKAGVPVAEPVDEYNDRFIDSVVAGKDVEVVLPLAAHKIAVGDITDVEKEAGDRYKAKVNQYVQRLNRLDSLRGSVHPKDKKAKGKIKSKEADVRKAWATFISTIENENIQQHISNLVRSGRSSVAAKEQASRDISLQQLRLRGIAGKAEPAEAPMTVDEENENLDRQMEEAEKDLKETLEDATLTPDQQLAKWNAKLEAEGKGELKPAAATPKETIDLIKQVDTQNPKLTVANDKDNGATDDTQLCLFTE